MENILDLENKAIELLTAIQYFKNNPRSKDGNYNSTIESFFENISGVDEFLKCMRPKGYFGMLPQKQDDLYEQYEMIEKIKEVREFVIRNYKKNKEIINKQSQ